MRAFKSFMFPQKSTNVKNCVNGICQHNTKEISSENNDILPFNVFDDENLFDVQLALDNLTDLNTNKIRDGFENQHQTIQYSPDIEFQVNLFSFVHSMRGIPMNIFDKIMDVIFMYCVEGNFDFITAYVNYT